MAASRQKKIKTKTKKTNTISFLQKRSASRFLLAVEKHFFNEHYLLADQAMKQFGGDYLPVLEKLNQHDQFYFLETCISFYLFFSAKPNQHTVFGFEKRSLGLAHFLMEETLSKSVDAYLNALKEPQKGWYCLIEWAESLFTKKGRKNVSLQLLKGFQNHYITAKHRKHFVDIDLRFESVQKMVEAGEDDPFKSPKYGAIKVKETMFVNILKEYKEEKYEEPRDQEIQQHSLSLIEKFTQAQDEQEYQAVRVDAYDLLSNFHPRDKVVKQGLFDLAFYVFNGSSFILNDQMVLSVSLEEGIVFCKSRDVQVVLSVLKKGTVKNEENASGHHSAKSIPPSPRILAMINGLRKEEYMNVYREGKLFLEELDDSTKLFHFQHQLFWVYLHALFYVDEKLRKKTKLSMDDCLLCVCESMDQVRLLMKNHYVAWHKLLESVEIFGGSNPQRTIAILELLDELFFKEKFLEGYSVTADGMLNRSMMYFQDLNEQRIKEEKKKRREELKENTKNKKIMQQLARPQKGNHVTPVKKEENEADVVVDEEQDAVDEPDSEEPDAPKLSRGQKKRLREKEKRSQLLEERQKEQAEEKQTEKELPQSTEKKEETPELPPPSQGSPAVQMDGGSGGGSPLPPAALEVVSFDRAAALFISQKNIYPHLKKLHEADRDCKTQKGSSIFIYGSVAFRFGILIYNADPKNRGSVVPANVNAYMQLADVSDVDSVIQLLETHGFTLLKKEGVKHFNARYVLQEKKHIKMECVMEGIKINFMIQAPEYRSVECMPSGRLVFKDEKYMNAERAVEFSDKSSSFILECLPDAAFEKMCRTLTFSIRPPVPKTESQMGSVGYCYFLYETFTKYGSFLKALNFAENLCTASLFFEESMKKPVSESHVHAVYHELLAFVKHEALHETSARSFVTILFRALLLHQQFKLSALEQGEWLNGFINKLKNDNPSFEHEVRAFSKKINELISDYSQQFFSQKNESGKASKIGHFGNSKSMTPDAVTHVERMKV